MAASELLVLAIDQGTTNTKAALVNPAGRIVAQAQAPVAISHPQPGWVEQDAEDIWSSVLQAADACVKGKESAIAALGISNQRESVLAWSASTGKPAGPCVTWQCRRGAAACDRVAGAGGAPTVQAKTGLPLDPLFSACKASWLAERAVCAAGDLRLGTVDSWLVWKLTGGVLHASDESNASRTQLFDIENGRWDEELCGMFAVPIAALPEVLPSDGDFGTVRGAAPLPDGLPVRAAIGDSHAALFGHGIIAPGSVKATYGTGSSLMTLLGPEGKADGGGGVAKTIAWNIGGQRAMALEGNILVSASALPWTAELLGLEGGAAELASLAETADDACGVHFVPALVGLGAPHWDGDARGLFDGLSFSAGREHLARAAMEAMAWQVCDVFDAMAQEADAPLVSLYADGGPSGNSWLMQLQADLLGCTVLQCKTPEVSALGAAGVAGIASGIWGSCEDFASLPRKRRNLEPAMDLADRSRLRDGWRQAVARARLADKPA